LDENATMRSGRSRAWIIAAVAFVAGAVTAAWSADSRTSRPAVEPAGGATNIDDGVGPASEMPSTATDNPTSSAFPTTTIDPVLGNGESVTLAFGGDVHFEDEIRAALDQRGPKLLSEIAPVLAGADLSVVNLETAITERGDPADKAYVFRAPVRALDALAAAGVDVVSIANNHGLDYGDVGFEDTLAAEAATGLPLIGIGRDAAEAYAPHVTVIRGQRIAVIGATQVLDGALVADWSAGPEHRGLASAKDVDRLLAAVGSARATSATVVVFLHWGTEKDTCPQDRQTTLARQLVDAGADVVVGGHAHRLQGAGRLGSAFVAYGLGNFVFYTDSGPGTSTGVLTVTVTGRRVDRYHWTPARIEGGLPVPLRGEEATEAEQEWQSLRACTDLQP
jgi:poly-gamma-glutamate capsule biosynthesis protein CapA/YwtB (metallophosphatase superfamily)